MTVWVSQPARDMETGHHRVIMVADTYDELHEAARSAGVPEDRFSGHDGTCKTRPHYVLTAEERLAVLGVPGADRRGVSVIFL